MSHFARKTISYRDGTIAYRYFLSNSDGSWRRPVETWKTSTVAEVFFGVPATEENQARYDFCPEHDNDLVGYILEYISGNPGCTTINWDVISDQWNESTIVGLSAGVMELRFRKLKQMYEEWSRFVRIHPLPNDDDDEWWATCPTEFKKFRGSPMATTMVQLLAQIPANFF